MIIYAFDHDEPEIFRGLHAKYGTLAVTVTIKETSSKDGVDYYHVSTKIKGKKECISIKVVYKPILLSGSHISLLLAFQRVCGLQ